MPKYYVSWIQDGGYCAAAHCHSIFEAPDLATAQSEWLNRVRDQQRVAAHTYSGEPRYEELWPLPDFLQNRAKAEILDFYSPPTPCRWLTYGRAGKGPDGKCHMDNQGGCGQGHHPYGCYQNRRLEWVSKWEYYASRT